MYIVPVNILMCSIVGKLSENTIFRNTKIEKKRLLPCTKEHVYMKSDEVSTVCMLPWRLCQRFTSVLNYVTKGVF